MAKETSPKIGTIRFTAKEKEIIAIGVESDFFKVIANKLRPQRQIKIAVACLNLAQNDIELHRFKGQSSESDWLVNELRKVAKEYNDANLDADTDGVDTED